MTEPPGELDLNDPTGPIAVHSDALQPDDDGGYLVLIDPEVTYDDFYAMWGPGPRVSDEGEYIIAAAIDSTTGDVHTGAMIALVPAVEDGVRLVYGGGESLDQLHLTLVYLGDAVDIDDESRLQLLEAVQRFVNDVRGPVVGHAFGLAVFNPTGDEPCVVTLVGGPRIDDDIQVPELTPLDEAHDAAINMAEESGIDTSQSKKPWIPHITLVYLQTTDALDALPVNDIAEPRLGSITFDRIRVAFGGEIHDFSIGPIVASAFHMPGKHNQKDHGKGGGGGGGGGGGDSDSGGGGSGGGGVTGEAAHDACPVSLEREGDVSPEEAAALSAYQRYAYIDINDGLRDPPPTPDAQAQIDAIDSAMSRSQLTEQIEVERVVSSGEYTFGDSWSGNMTGGEFTDAGYTSTTTNPDVSRGDPRSRQSARMILTVPAGTGAVSIGDAQGESEILLDRGSRWRITGDTGPGRGRVIQMELIV